MKHLAHLKIYFARYKWRILAGIFFVICANALSVCNPMITSYEVDLIADNLGKVRSGGHITAVLHSQVGGTC